MKIYRFSYDSRFMPMEIGLHGHEIPNGWAWILFQYPGAYCIKRIFLVKKRSESEQMLIHFSDVKKGLFLLFQESLGREVNLYFIFEVLYRHEDGRRTL